jgi:hypothetical protein
LRRIEEGEGMSEQTREGAIWHTSWGYDQTNVEFFQVVRELPKSVVLRRIGSEVRDGRLYPVPDRWTTDLHLMGNPGTPSRLRDEERGYSEKMCRKPRHRSVVIDDVRYAFPYEGGGQYDTYAAGGMGH